MSDKISLEKKLEKDAPKILNLVKKADITLKKKNLNEHKAKVALCLDISASMGSLYSSGKIQRFAEKILSLGCRFDDNASIDIFLFGENAYTAGEMTIDNFSDFINDIQKRFPLECGTYYGKIMQVIRNFYFTDAKGEERNSPVSDKMPVYVMFVTDGASMDENYTEKQIKWGSYEPIFWQFMAIGKSKKDIKSKGIGGFFAKLFASDFSFLEKLDTMEGRYVDNANFFSVEDPETVPDEEFFDLLMEEYPSWLKLARENNLLK